MKDIFSELNDQDWENFAEDLLFHLGYQTKYGPSVGCDSGLDLIVSKGSTRYLVSCKHHVKPVGVSKEIDIRDRLERHDCQGFIAFYSSTVTSELKRKFRDLRAKNIKIVELYRKDILEIIPTMMGFTLQKYFSEPHKLHHHVNANMTYNPLPCVKGCGNLDILSKEHMPWSMITLYKDNDKLNFEYGCKKCINGYPEHNLDEFIPEILGQYNLVEIYWMEISQVRFFEEFFKWRDIILLSLNNLNVTPAPDFYKNLSTFQMGLMQIMVPQGWGVWLPENYEAVNIRIFF